MKRIIPLLAVAIAMALPATLSAQTTEELYYGYDNPIKTVLVELIEEAINAGTVSFDTQAHEDEFLALISDLYHARDVEDWSTVVTSANQLCASSANVSGSSLRELVESLCSSTKDSYLSASSLMVLSPEDESILQYGLANDGIYGGASILGYSKTTHVDFITIVHGKGGSSWILLPCCTITIVVYDDGRH